jgi:3-oxoacyl-[acyl-carrier protein] reductase
VARTEADLGQAETEIRGQGGRAHGFVADVSDGAAVEAMVQDVLDRFGQVDILVNSAFWGPPGSLLETDEAFWDRTIDSCLKGPYLCTRAVYPAMRARGAGAIVNIGSAAGKVGEDNRTAYCAAKWGLEGLTAALQIELHKVGIRVHLLSPGATDTSFWREHAPGLTDEQRVHFIPPETVADALVWVLSTPDSVHVPDVAINNYRDPFEGKGSPFET